MSESTQKTPATAPVHKPVSSGIPSPIEDLKQTHPLVIPPPNVTVEEIDLRNLSQGVRIKLTAYLGTDGAQLAPAGSTVSVAVGEGGSAYGGTLSDTDLSTPLGELNTGPSHTSEPFHVPVALAQPPGATSTKTPDTATITKVTVEGEFLVVKPDGSLKGTVHFRSQMDI